MTRQKLCLELQAIFGKLGYMETSSSDLFSQFLRMGVGAKPIIAGYESQLIEYASIHPEEYEKIKDDIVMLYPSPTGMVRLIFLSPWTKKGRIFSMLFWMATSRKSHGNGTDSAPEITERCPIRIPWRQTE